MRLDRELRAQDISQCSASVASCMPTHSKMLAIWLMGGAFKTACNIISTLLMLILYIQDVEFEAWLS